MLTLPLPAPFASDALPAIEGPLTVAIVADHLPEYASSMAAAGARVLWADAGMAGLLPQDAPDVVIFDTPFVLSNRRAALLVAQLRWAKPEVVVIVADGMIGADHGIQQDLNFDPALGPDHAADALTVARTILARARLRDSEELTRPVAVPRPALWHRPKVRRVSLFR